MGQSNSQVFKEDELQDYKDLTYFTRKEILHAFQRFKELDPQKVSRDKFAVIPMEKVIKLPELQVNPFRDRICQVFSSNGNGEITFEDFLDMMSVFSENAPRTVKIEYAFRIFDFDGDDVLSAKDISQILKRLTGDKLTKTDKDYIVKEILKEADLDEDGYLAYAEFEHVISKSPDFMNSFQIRL